MNSIRLIIFLTLIASHAFAYGGEGGHTGNGGGAIECKGTPAVTLDFYEAVQNHADLLPIETLSREQFFKVILSRLSQVQTYKDQSTEMALIDLKHIQDFIVRNGPADQWPTTENYRVHDEASDELLPKNCTFFQAAITRSRISYQVGTNLLKLSEGQKRVLELHEALFDLGFYAGTGALHFGGTSWLIRKFVGTLIQKKISHRELQMAAVQFRFPHLKVIFKNGRAITDGQLLRSPFPVGAYVLDSKSADPKPDQNQCPSFIGFGTVDSTTSYLYLFGGDDRYAIRGKFLPTGSLQIFDSHLEGRYQNNSYTRYRQTNESEKKLDFTIKSSESGFLFVTQERECKYTRPNPFSNFNSRLPLRNHHYWGDWLGLKNLIDYFETKSRSKPSDFEEEIQAILQEAGNKID